jgi:Polyketide cyclase / dehydrase and lipid transport
MSQTYSIVAKTTPSAAYAYVADLTLHPQWSPDEMKMESVTPGPAAVGSQYKAVGNLLGRPNSATVTITAMEPGKRFSFESQDGNSEWAHEFNFTGIDGGTQIDRIVNPIKAPPGFAILAVILNPFVIRPGSMKSMGMLRDRLEATSAAK